MNDHCEIKFIDGEIEKAGWRVYQVSWQSHRNGKPIKAGHDGNLEEYLRQGN